MSHVIYKASPSPIFGYVFFRLLVFFCEIGTMLRNFPLAAVSKYQTRLKNHPVCAIRPARKYASNLKTKQLLCTIPA